jgi:predicted lipoprotein with Yx(FWY)xxD motif
MTTIRRIFRAGLAILGALALTGLLLAGCGGSGSTTTTVNSSAGDDDVETIDDTEHAVRAPSGYESGEPAGQVATAPRVAVVKMSPAAKPKVVVDEDGMTVYEFRRDDPMIYQFEADAEPTCYRACTAMWYPVLTDDAPRAAQGAEPAMVGTVERVDGGIQVTYDGHPLYLFAGDRKPGEMNGDDARSFGARWHALERDGDVYIASSQ